MRKYSLSTIFVLLLVTLIHAPQTAQERRAITQKDLDFMVQNRALIIQGRVINVEAKLMDGYMAYGNPGARGRLLPATEVVLGVEKVIAGEYDDKTIAIVLKEGTAGGTFGCRAGVEPMNVRVGDHAIVGIGPDSRQTGYHVLEHDTNFFRLDGRNLIPYRNEYHLAVDRPLDVITKKAKEREMPEIIRTADLICIGTVTKLMDPGEPSRKAIVSIDEMLKGSNDKSEITIDLSDVYQRFRLRQPGYKVMLFLNKIATEYKPVAGVNGYYAVEGEKLSRGHDVPLRISVSQLKSTVKMWEEIRQ